MDDQITFRPASAGDSLTIARLYQIAADGVADYVWSKLAEPGEDILEVGRRRYARENTSFSYQNCMLAVENDAIIGMLAAFPLYVDPEETQDDPVLAPYAKLEEDESYYICGVAVFPEARGRGIGTEFMRFAEQAAHDLDLQKLSLIVFAENEGARRLYTRLGYREVMREPIVAHPLIHYSGDALLMVKAL